MSEIPKVKILDGIRPTNAGHGDDRLLYSSTKEGGEDEDSLTGNGLLAAVDFYRNTHNARSAMVWLDSGDSMIEEQNARELAAEYLLRTAERTVNCRDEVRELWADRFTLASKEYYGEPSKGEATMLLRHDFGVLQDLRGDNRFSQPSVEFLIKTFQPILEQAQMSGELGEDIAEQERQAMEQYGNAIRDTYQPVFDLVEKSDKKEYGQDDLHQLFTDAFTWLTENDDQEWSLWEAVKVEGTSVSVSSADRQIRIPSKRKSASPQGACALVAHELFGHALRAKNGYKTGDTDLAAGLPGYLDAEEGLGVYNEEAVNGSLEDKLYDGYLDIALALGTIDSNQRSRQEVFKISLAEQILVEQMNGTFKESDIDAIKTRVWSRVDRIYRGGRGDEQGSRQAIFTKDISYYVGYKRIASFVRQQIADGKSAHEVFSYLSQAKFDPTIPAHVQRIDDVVSHTIAD